ncbi:hypothetical protein BH23BAC4_BH23BAC4_04380 [soil metagenome]
MTVSIVLFDGFGGVLLEVAFALLPLVVFFGLFQVFLLRMPLEEVARMMLGIVLTFFGLAFFLQGVHVGFLPVGREIGEIFGGRPNAWLLIPVGFALGFVATFAEPAVRVLVYEVDKATAGSISRRLLLWTLSSGVAISIAISMARVLFAIPIWYLILPGYGIALVLMFFSTNTFTSIAFDSGGVATGPMTVTFILAIALGYSDTLEGRDPLIDGFGMIALVALAPIVCVLVIGLLFNRQPSN